MTQPVGQGLRAGSGWCGAVPCGQYHGAVQPIPSQGNTNGGSECTVRTGKFHPRV